MARRESMVRNSKRIRSTCDCRSALAWQTFHSKKCFTCLTRSGIMNASAMCTILYIFLIDCLPHNVMNILVPSLMISTLLVHFVRNKPFILSFISRISTAQASISSSFTTILCVWPYPFIICGMLSMWLLWRYAFFNNLCEASQISLKNCGKLLYCEIWSLQCISKWIFAKLKCESSTKAWFTRYAHSSLSSASAWAFWASVHPLAFSSSLRAVVCAFSLFETMSVFAFATLPAQYLKNTSLDLWNYCKYSSIYPMVLSIWLRYGECSAKSVKYYTQVITFLKSCSCPTVRCTTFVFLHREAVNITKMTIRIDRVFLPETWLKSRYDFRGI